MRLYNSVHHIREDHEKNRGTEFEHLVWYANPPTSDLHGVYFLGATPGYDPSNNHSPALLYRLYHICPQEPHTVLIVEGVPIMLCISDAYRVAYEYFRRTGICFNCNFGLLPAEDDEDFDLCDICDGDGRVERGRFWSFSSDS